MRNRFDHNFPIKAVFFSFCILGMVFSLLLGCEKAAEKEATDETTLEQVALKYWNNRLVSRNYQASYERELNSDALTFEKYRALVSKNENLQFSVLKVTTEEIGKDNEARLDVHITVILKSTPPMIPVTLDRNFKDKWVYTSGVWKHRYSKIQP